MKVFNSGIALTLSEVDEVLYNKNAKVIKHYTKFNNAGEQELVVTYLGVGVYSGVINKNGETYLLQEN